MAWTTPHTWVAGAVVTASQLNQHLRDNLLAIRAGDITALDAAQLTGTIDAARLPEVSVIQSIQRGVIVIPIGTGVVSNTATITAVVVSKAHVIHLGSNQSHQGTARLELTNATTVTAQRTNPYVDPGVLSVGYVVVEFT